MLEKILKELVERRAWMAIEVFESPPSDWAAFQKRLGGYIELADLIAIVKEAMAGKEDNDQ